MPVKRRAAKRRIDPARELEAYGQVFETSFDFFGEMADLTGLQEPHRACPASDQLADRAEHERSWREAIREAWCRLGPMFLANYAGTGLTWAEREFGRPWEAANAS